MSAVRVLGALGFIGVAALLWVGICAGELPGTFPWPAKSRVADPVAFWLSAGGYGALGAVCLFMLLEG